MMPEPLIRVERVSRRFGTRVVLRDISLTVSAGECVALLGANGAGKTTLLRAIATLARPTRGRIVAFGTDAWQARPQVRARIGVVAHQPWVYPELSCRENLRFFATMYALPDAATRVDATLRRVGLEPRADERAATLSRGLLQRLNIARALLHDPSVLILDEPDTGLDVPGRTLLAAIVRDQAVRGGCVVLTTHALDFALELATRVVVLAGARVALDAPRAGLDAQAVGLAIAPEPALVG